MSGWRTKRGTASRPRPRPHRHDRGFTLIEVLVALAILAITMGFALRVFSGALASAAVSEHQQAALTLAEAMLARTGTEIGLQEGDINGVTSDGFAWRVHVTPDAGATGCATPRCTNPLRAMRIQVSVGWTEHRHAHQVQLSTLRLAPTRGP